MKKKEKIDEIVNFVINHPDSTASRAILRRFYLNKYRFESSKELGFELHERLEEKGNDEIEFCFYLVK